MTSFFDLVPAYVLAVFEDGVDAVADPVASVAADPVTSAPATGGDPRRGHNGRFQPLEAPQSADPAAALRVIEEANRRLQSADQRIAELNEENKQRRQAERETRSMIETSNKRVIRAEARAALVDAGLVTEGVAPDTVGGIISLFVGSLGDKVKIDPGTGEPVGIREGLESWKSANPAFFRAAAAAAAATTDPAAATTAATAAATDNPARANATATGATPAGSDNVTAVNTGGLPDLRTLTPQQRVQAMRTYKQSLRR